MNPGGPHLYGFAEIPSAVKNTPDFHDITDNHIKNGEVPDWNSVIGILPVFSGAVGFKGLRTVQTLPDGGFNIIYQSFGGGGILETECNIVNNFV